LSISAQETCILVHKKTEQHKKRAKRTKVFSYFIRIRCSTAPQQ